MTDPTVGTPAPLSLASEAWRLLACVAISVLLFGTVAVREWDEHQARFTGEIVLGGFAFAIVVFRRRWPVPVALTLAVLNAYSGIAAGPATLAAVSVATRRRWREVLLVGLANALAASVYVLGAPFGVEGFDDTAIALTATTGLNIAIMGWGMYIGSRRDLLADLIRRAHQAETEQEFRVSQARNTERTRIAREMHDVVAHRISLVSLQAGALAFREDLPAPRLRAGLEEIQGLANAALDELRGVLGVLREDSTAPAAPQPTYPDISKLTGDAVRAGMAIEFDDTLAQPSLLPNSLGRTLYRIVQEGVTNARKHAPGQLLRVGLSGSPTSGVTFTLHNRVVDPSPNTPGAGLGLVGIRELAELSGGHLDVRCEDGWFSLEGWLPWRS